MMSNVMRPELIFNKGSYPAPYRIKIKVSAI